VIMKTCRSCGSQWNEAQRFCSRCGSALDPPSAISSGSPFAQVKHPNAGQSPFAAASNTVNEFVLAETVDEVVPEVITTPSSGMRQTAATFATKLLKEIAPPPPDFRPVAATAALRSAALHHLSAAIPPPPESGAISVFWVREGRMLRRAAAPLATESGSAASTAGNLSVNDVVLPPAPSPWPWQIQAKQVADQLLNPSSKATAAESPQNHIVSRVLRAAFGEPAAYREVAQDSAADGQAWGVVVAAMLASSLGWALLAMLAGDRLSLFSVALGGATGVAGWFAGTLAVWAIWRAWLQSPLPFAAVLRAEGFSMTPGIIRVIPLIGQVAGLWTFVTSAVAKRSIAGASTPQVIILMAAQTIVQMVVALVAYAILSSLKRG
jgi:hypothetical protein